MNRRACSRCSFARFYTTRHAPWTRRRFASIASASERLLLRAGRAQRRGRPRPPARALPCHRRHLPAREQPERRLSSSSSPAASEAYQQAPVGRTLLVPLLLRLLLSRDVRRSATIRACPVHHFAAQTRCFRRFTSRLKAGALSPREVDGTRPTRPGSAPQATLGANAATPASRPGLWSARVSRKPSSAPPPREPGRICASGPRSHALHR